MSEDASPLLNLWVMTMRKRQLGIVNRTPTSTTGMCGHCYAKFESANSSPDRAEEKIQAAFDAHKCELTNIGQNAMRSGRVFLSL
jgi:hypothetical protein